MRPHSSQGFGIFSSALFRIIFCFMFSLEIILLSNSYQLLWYTDTHIMRVGLTS